jgi:hypothetical protein
MEGGRGYKMPCGVEEETTLHAVWNYPAAKDVSRGSSSCFHRCYSEGTNFLMLFEYCLQRFSREVLDLMAVTAHQIWLRRNAWVFLWSLYSSICCLYRSGSFP